MALGDVTQIVSGTSYAVELLASATAANGIPSGTNGISTELLGRLGRIPPSVRIGVKSTAGSGTMTVTLRVWQRMGSIGWFVGEAIEASSATPQAAVAIAETGTDSIAYTTPVEMLQAADRIYLEITVIAGSATAVTGYAFVAL